MKVNVTDKIIYVCYSCGIDAYGCNGCEIFLITDDFEEALSEKPYVIEKWYNGKLLEEYRKGVDYD